MRGLLREVQDRAGADSKSRQIETWHQLSNPVSEANIAVIDYSYYTGVLLKEWQQVNQKLRKWILVCCEPVCTMAANYFWDALCPLQGSSPCVAQCVALLTPSPREYNWLVHRVHPLIPVFFLPLSPSLFWPTKRREEPQPLQPTKVSEPLLRKVDILMPGFEHSSTGDRAATRLALLAEGRHVLSEVVSNEALDDAMDQSKLHVYVPACPERDHFCSLRILWAASRGLCTVAMTSNDPLAEELYKGCYEAVDSLAELLERVSALLTNGWQKAGQKCRQAFLDANSFHNIFFPANTWSDLLIQHCPSFSFSPQSPLPLSLPSSSSMNLHAPALAFYLSESIRTGKICNPWVIEVATEWTSQTAWAETKGVRVVRIGEAYKSLTNFHPAVLTISLPPLHEEISTQLFQVKREQADQKCCVCVLNFWHRDLEHERLAELRSFANWTADYLVVTHSALPGQPSAENPVWQALVCFLRETSLETSLDKTITNKWQLVDHWMHQSGLTVLRRCV